MRPEEVRLIKEGLMEIVTADDHRVTDLQKRQARGLYMRLEKQPPLKVDLQVAETYLDKVNPYA